MNQKEQQQMEALTAEAALRLRQPPRRRSRLKPERVQQELKSMPGWSLAVDGKALEHARKLAHPAGAAKYAAYVAEMAAAEGQPVHVGLSGFWVLLTLTRRPGTEGLTMPVLDFARQLG